MSNGRDRHGVGNKFDKCDIVVEKGPNLSIVIHHHWICLSIHLIENFKLFGLIGLCHEY
jgi:hypothetical protein